MSRPIFITILLLIASNIFMTYAWYGHLMKKDTALWIAILVSWLIAFFEYCLQVPANRIGHSNGLSGAELKTIQEVITLAVFCVFSVLYMKEGIKWNVILGFVFIIIGATCVFEPWKREEAKAPATRQVIPSQESHETK